LTVPASLKTCRDAPYAPKQDTQKEAAKYVTKLGGAYLDCKEKLNAVVGIIEKSAESPQKK
jgi:hypothetical protein